MLIRVTKSKVNNHVQLLKQKLSAGLNRFLLQECFGHCKGHTAAATRVCNMSDRPVELQIRVGSILKRVHTLKPGRSKRLKGRNIYKAYMPRTVESRNLLYCYDETCQPYLWIHDSGADFSRMVKQQYISLEDLRECSEIRILRDHQRGCIAVRKKPRPEVC